MSLIIHKTIAMLRTKKKKEINIRNILEENQKNAPNQKVIKSLFKIINSCHQTINHKKSY